jgi:hypothetical protein
MRWYLSILGAFLTLSGALCLPAALHAQTATNRPATNRPATRPADEDASLGDDYEPDNRDWNGLWRLVALAEALGIEAVVHEELDYAKLDVSEPLLIVFPGEELDAKSLGRFAIAGGRVLLADDFGASGALLDRLDLERVTPVRGSVPHDQFVDENRALPRIEPSGRHPLLEDVDAVVANHPAILFNVGGPVVRYSGGGGLVYDMNLGEGKVVVLADPSMLVNHMLQVADNAALARNALAYLCRGEPEGCRLHLYVKSFEQSGRYTDPDDRRDLGSLDQQIIDELDELNDRISSFMEKLPAAELFFYLGILLALGLAVYLYTIFPLRKTRPYSRYLDRLNENVHAPQSEFDWNLARFVDAGSGTNYALPVSILKEIFEEIFLDALGHWPSKPGQRPDIAELGRLFAIEHLGEDAFGTERNVEREVVDLLGEFARVPTRHRVFLESDSYYSERDLLQLYRRSIKILDIMGRKEEYERRTRSNLV